MKDQLLKFLFDNHGVRGEIVQQDQSIKDLLEAHNYPHAIAKLLMELSSVAILLAASLKKDDEIMVQIQNKSQEHKLRYAVINIKKDLKFYGLASYNQDISYDDMSFRDLIGNDSILGITIIPAAGKQYQGIVPLEKDDLASCIEDYFLQSEQLDTKILLFSDVEQRTAAAMLLQIIPNIDDNKESLNHLFTLAQTLTKEEIFSLEKDHILSLLFAHEEVRVFEPLDLSFACICSKARFLDALKRLKVDDIKDMLQDDETILTCQHCGKKYTISQDELRTIYNLLNQ